MADALGDRMKEYEQTPSLKLPKRLPIIIRIDGRAFHTVTRNFQKPFDKLFVQTMQQTALALCEQVSDCRFAYTESDEISLLVYPKNLISAEPFFDNKIQKICSITASIATMAFYKNFVKNFNEWKDETKESDGDKLAQAYQTVVDKGINFDSRCFVLPLNEVVNYFIWRQQDATKNSIQMVARTLYSHKELQGKGFSQLNELLFAKGVNFDQLPTVWKRGTGIFKVPTPIVVEGHTEPLIRNKWYIDNEMPIITDHREYITQHMENE